MLIYIYDFMVWKLKYLTLVESMEEWCDLLEVPSVWQETVEKNELKLGTVDSRVQCIRRFQVMRSWQVAHKSEDTHNFCIRVTLFWQINFLSFIFLPLGQMIRLHFSCHPPVQRQSVNGTLFTLHLMAPMVLIPTMYCTVGGEVLLAEGVISLLLQVFPSSLVDFP